MASASAQATAVGIVKSISDEQLVLAVPGTDYQLHLVPGGGPGAEAGKRVRGTIHARALRMHAASGGGRFIEPVLGVPRIVAGTVLETDEPNQRVLVDAVVPMWVTWPDAQDQSVLQVGRLVNFYVESGTTFTLH